MGAHSELIYVGGRRVPFVVQLAIEQEHIDRHIGGPEILLAGDEPLPDGMAFWRNHDLWTIGRVETCLRLSAAAGRLKQPFPVRCEKASARC